MKTINHIRKGLLAVLVAMLMPAGVWAQVYSTPVAVMQNADGTWTFTMPGSTVVGQVTVQEATAGEEEPTETVELPTVGPASDGWYYTTNWGEYAYKINGNTEAFIAHVTDDGTLLLEEIVDHKIPKNTAVVLRSKTTPITVTPVVVSDYEDVITGNELTGRNYVKTPGTGEYVYALALDGNKKPGFAPATSVAPFRAFVILDEPVSADNDFMPFDVTHTTYYYVDSNNDEDIDVRYFRTFDEGVASTICLPFDQELTSGKIYEFKGVDKDAFGEWTAVMQEPEADMLTQDVPYLFMPTETVTLTYTGTINPHTRASDAIATVGDWQLLGNHQNRIMNEKCYGFSADEVAPSGTTEGVHAGDFVKVGSYVMIRAFRARLRYLGTDETFLAPGVNGAQAPEVQLPERIRVILYDKNSNPTAIGTLNTETGEASDWYDLSGRKLDKQPAQKGVYINNGKKVIKK